MAYAVAGRVKTFRSPGYPDAPLVPHGMAVAVNAPAVFRAFASTAPARHLEAAALLGTDTRGATEAEAGQVLAASVIELMRAIGIPNGVAGVGYSSDDLDALVAGTLPQQRLLANAPLALDGAAVRDLFANALHYW
jgi:alcohol dehydrogenase class IV